MKSKMSLTTGSIPKTLFAFALPILIGNIMQSINGSINAIWIGKYLGTAALAATNNANIVMFLLLGAVFGITTASTILIAQNVGAKNMAEAKRVVGTSATFFFLLSLVLSVCGFLLSPVILGWMDTPPDAFRFGVEYLSVMFVSLPPSYAFFFINSALRGAGDSKTPLKYLLMSVGLDIVLNPILIFGIGPIPAFGIAGSALATLIGTSFSLVAMIRHIYKTKNPLALHAGEFYLLRIDWNIMRSMITKGIPMGLQMIVLSSSMVLFMSVVNRFGSDTAAAFAADMQLWNYVQMPALALGVAVSSMAAQNIGANLWNRVTEITYMAVLLNFLFTGIPVLLIFLFDIHAIGLFLPENSASLPIAVHLNQIVLWSFPLFGVTMVLSGVVRAAGAVFAPLIVLAIAMLFVRMPLAFYSIEHWGADGAWWSFTISAIVGAVLIACYYGAGTWRSARMMTEVSTPV